MQTYDEILPDAVNKKKNFSSNFILCILEISWFLSVSHISQLLNIFHPSHPCLLFFVVLARHCVSWCFTIFLRLVTVATDV